MSSTCEIMEIDKNRREDKCKFEQESVDYEKYERNDSRDIEVAHEELMNVTSKTLNDILKQDTILNDLPEDVTLEEVTSQIAVQHGQSMTIYIVRGDCEEIPVVVHQNGARVIDLKRSVQRHMVMYLKRRGGHNKISWHYIWKTNNLVFGNERLKNDQSLLSDFGIRNKSRVAFMKRLREKGATYNT